MSRQIKVLANRLKRYTKKLLAAPDELIVINALARIVAGVPLRDAVQRAVDSHMEAYVVREGLHLVYGLHHMRWAVASRYLEQISLTAMTFPDFGVRSIGDREAVHLFYMSAFWRKAPQTPKEFIRARERFHKQGTGK